MSRSHKLLEDRPSSYLEKKSCIHRPKKRPYWHVRQKEDAAALLEMESISQAELEFSGALGDTIEEKDLFGHDSKMRSEDWWDAGPFRFLSCTIWAVLPAVQVGTPPGKVAFFFEV